MGKKERVVNHMVSSRYQPLLLERENSIKNPNQKDTDNFVAILPKTSILQFTPNFLK